MTLLTIARTVEAEHPAYVDSFVRAYRFSWTIASWWTTIGGTGDNSTEDPTILDVFVNSISYLEADDVATCIGLEGSWYYDQPTTQLYVHFAHTIVPEAATVEYGSGQGYSDNDVLYVGQTEYRPLLEDVPQIEKSQDIRQYDRLAFLNANVTLTNHGGILDSVLDETIIGNTAILAYLPDDKVVDQRASSADAVTIGTFFVETIAATPQGFSIGLQDRRKISVKVPTDTFDKTTYPDLGDNDSGAIIPLVYGQHRGLPGVKVDAKALGTTDATYRIAIELTALTTVEVRVNDTWEARTPSSTTLSTGTFTIPNAREAAGKEPYDVRVSCTGISVTYTPDIIVDLYQRFLSDGFIQQYYDINTWNSEKVKISTAALYLDEKLDLFDVIARIQNGIFPSFRFDITPTGKKIIKADDRDKASTAIVESWENFSIDSTDVKDDVTYLFSGVTVAYNQEQISNKFERVTNSDYESDVNSDYQVRNTTEIKALVPTSGLATSMAAALAEDFRRPTRTVTFEAAGEKFFGIDIYDVILVNTCPCDDVDLYTIDLSGQRLFAGVLYIQVLGVAPGLQSKMVTITGRVLLDRPFTPITTNILAGQPGLFLGAEDGTFIESQAGELIKTVETADNLGLFLAAQDGRLLLGA